MPKYDRELIARMLETPAVFEDASRREQARLLREADNLEADARTVVREAAPDLLAVVQELEESAGYWSEYDVPLGIVDRLRAAIAKATGHQQNAAQGGGEK